MIPFLLTPPAVFAFAQHSAPTEAKRWYWCNRAKASRLLRIEVKVDGQKVGDFTLPLRLGPISEISSGGKQRIAAYHFNLRSKPNRDFRGVTNGKIEGNFWVALATDEGIDFGHSWVSADKIVLHEIVPTTADHDDQLDGDGIQIRIKWLHTQPPA